MPKQTAEKILKSTNYLLFIFGVSLLAACNSAVFLATFFFKWGDLVSRELGVLVIVDFALGIILFTDFAIRFYAAPVKHTYFFKYGWLDLIGSIPTLAIFRLVRMFWTIKALGYKGKHVVLAEFRKARASGAMFIIVWLVLVVLEFSGVAVLIFEDQVAGANIVTSSDALWWGFQTITTVGYGDRYPVTNAGRLVGVVLMTVGVGLFGTFTAWLANWFFGPSEQAAGPAADEPAPSEPTSAEKAAEALELE